MTEKNSVTAGEAGSNEGLGRCEYPDCTCAQFVPKNNTALDFCKTCNHRDIDHKLT